MSTRRSLAFSFVDRYASLAIGIGWSMIIARLLTPAEIGVFSVAMVFIGLLSTMRDMGAGQYLLQEKKLTPDRIRAVWTVQLGIGVALAAAVLALSAPVASFYEDQRLKAIMYLLAFNYLVNPLGAVTHAWLMREMRYDAIALMRFSGTLAGAVTSVFLALRGYGPISLAWGSLATTLLNATASVFFRPKGYPWMPGLRELRRVLSFGSKVTPISIALSIASGAPEFLLGKLQSLTAAGLFSRAQGLVSMFGRLVSDAVYPVAFSLFAKELRESQDTSTSFVKAISYITALSWSFAVVLALLAHPIVRFLYGDQWNASVDLTRILAAAMALGSPVPLCRAALLAAGAATQALKATLLTVAVTLPLMASAAALGLHVLSGALVLSAAISLVILMWWTHKVVVFDCRKLAMATAKSLAVSAATAFAPGCAVLAWGTRPTQIMLPLTVGLLGSLIGFLLSVYATRHPLADEIRRISPSLSGLVRFRVRS